MSHSQFHCIKSFILRHAWLNLLDKHMTTGRINQVTFIVLWDCVIYNDLSMYEIYINITLYGSTLNIDILHVVCSMWCGFSKCFAFYAFKHFVQYMSHIANDDAVYQCCFSILPCTSTHSRVYLSVCLSVCVCVFVFVSIYDIIL